jgi:hypothetical protein
LRKAGLDAVEPLPEPLQDGLHPLDSGPIDELIRIVVLVE